ncbi:MAG: adenylate/guanylate cyclase domain-containing protein [Spirochaetia bacterium]|nr:adenylate/guanylate cyclase domain-containing protein [Spirochaetota bacterium]MDW8111927.1 adenylate/guanylate cyclase domain-containing protein [Spirochaetia bacterium]
MRRFSNLKIKSTPLRIAIIFSIFILFSNLITNYINLSLNNVEIVNQSKKILANDLRLIYNYANNQYDLFVNTGNFEKAFSNIVARSINTFENKGSVCIGISNNKIIFSSSTFEITNISITTLTNLEGSVEFMINGNKYFGFYKFNQKFNFHIVRAENENEFYEYSRRVFFNISLIVVGITLIMFGLGLIVVFYILRYIRKITNSILEMVEKEQLGIIDVSKADNNDITFLAMSFNSLSSLINTLLDIFKRFVNKDTVMKVYQEKEVRLEGHTKELSILFSDIRSFTFMTETLGNNIINLLNLHYSNAISKIVQNNGSVISIIGDALLVVFGLISDKGKSYDAIKSAYDIQRAAKMLRDDMKRVRDDLISMKGYLTEEEEKIYKAVMIEVGVGIDGGEIFYGNVGSYERMTNTVIGDAVNSASRLEGLTKYYKLPVIVSEYVKNDVENMPYYKSDIIFLEIDNVAVKGKKESRRIYLPIFENEISDSMKREFEMFSKALKLYYDGNWKEAYNIFASVNLPFVDIFIERTRVGVAPQGWGGVWEMKEK